MWFLIYALTWTCLVVMKAFQVRRALVDGSYAWKRGIILVLVWLAVLVPGLYVSCGADGCRAQTGLGWLQGLLAGLPLPAQPSSQSLASETLAACVLLAVGALSVYGLGHSLGWLMHGARRLWPARA